MAATSASSAASPPGRSEMRVKTRMRRPAAVSWRRATAASRPASMLPPDSTTTVAPSRAGPTTPSSSAATPTAPAPSTTSLARSSRRTIASATSSSPTTHSSSTSRSTSGRVTSPGRLMAMPSAIVAVLVAASGRAYGEHAFTCTPVTSTSGRTALIAPATPLTRPPPPIGMITLARSGTSASSSSPSVAWPRITSGSSNGCTNAAPVSSARRRAAATQSSTESPSRWTVPPKPSTAATLATAASSGMKTSHGRPRARAA